MAGERIPRVNSQNEDNGTGGLLDDQLPKLRHVTTGTGRIAYREAGNGPPIVLFHGMNGQSGSWLYQFKGLSAANRVIAWDAPGYGGSDPCDGDIDDFARVAHEFFESASIETPLLVGHSMGGVIAGRVAINYPEAISALVLSCSHWGWGEPSGQPLRSRYAKRIDELRSMGIEEFAALRASKMVSANTAPETKKLLEAMSGAITSTALSTVGRANQEADNLPGLSQVNIPIYLLYSEFDKVIRYERTRTMIEHLSHAKVVKLTGVGHAPYVEDPEQYNEVIRSILESLPA